MPGIIGVLLSMTMVVITSVAVVRERERGTLEQLIVTPISRTGLLLGKIVPFVLVGYVQISVILLLGRLVFHVPMLGSLPLLYAVALPFIFASLAIGILLSTLVQTQAQAMQMGFLFLLPNILLSGFMFPARGDARPGAVARRHPAADVFPAGVARSPAQAGGPRRRVAPGPGADRICLRGRGGGGGTLQENAGIAADQGDRRSMRHASPERR